MYLLILVRLLIRMLIRMLIVNLIFMLELLRTGVKLARYGDYFLKVMRPFVPAVRAAQQAAQNEARERAAAEEAPGAKGSAAGSEFAAARCRRVVALRGSRRS